MFNDLDETIANLLYEEIPAAFRPDEDGITFDPPNRTKSIDWQGSVSPVINCFLYDVRENNLLRQPPWQQAPGNGNEAHKKRSLLRIDCNYILTVWSMAPSKEHGALAHCLLALSRHPILSEGYMPENSLLKQQPLEIQTRVAAHDKLTNPAELWTAIDNDIRPSLSYVVTLSLDPWSAEIITTPLVRTRRMQTEDPYERIVTGTVRNAQRRPVAGATISIAEPHHVTQSDDRGRFMFFNLHPGTYQVTIEAPDYEPHSGKITVPGAANELVLRRRLPQ